VRLVAACLTAVALGGCAAAAPPPPPLAADLTGRVPVTSGRGAAAVTLSGVLALPAGDAAAPAVVLMHGCSGVTGTVRRWADALGRWGYATFVLDSFGGRGIASVCESGALRSEDRVDDAYAGLALLARHPRVDASRIVLMGFSHGGGVVLLAGAQWVARGYGGAGVPAFRAFIAFYPRCEGRHPGPLAGPLRVHIGALDDWTPAPPCEVMVESLRSRRADARITVYAGARHAFDAVGLPPERWLPNVQAPRGRRGASIGHSPEATALARDNVRRELAELLRGGS
jgi:dienelactone hydrolase